MSRDISTILVTGATGFVGTALCPLLSSYGEVRAALWQKEDGLYLPAYVSPVVIGSIGRDTDWRVALHGIDVVIHLAARVHVMSDKTLDPLGAYREVNTLGTETLARQAVAAGVRRLVFVSTIKVNGEQTHDGEAFTDTDVPNPQDPYGVSKMEAEMALTNVAKESGLEVVIVRPPMMYGPDVKANLRTLMKLVDRGVPLPTRSIKNERSLLFVQNLAAFLTHCVTEPAAANQVYLLSDGQDVSTSELISAIARAMKKPDRQFPFPDFLAQSGARLLRKEAFYSRLWGSLKVDSTKAREQLKWRAPFSFIGGIQATVDKYLSKSGS
jgi:nucleoside-diphosphate-sugar epimerase